MADGKQWYNSPQDGAAGKNGGKPSGPAKKQAKPGVKPAGNGQFRSSGKNAGIIPGRSAQVNSAKTSGKPSGKMAPKQSANMSAKTSANMPSRTAGNMSARPSGSNMVNPQKAGYGTGSANAMKRPAGTKPSSGAKQTFNGKTAIKGGQPGSSNVPQKQPGIKGKGIKSGKGIIPQTAPSKMEAGRKGTANRPASKYSGTPQKTSSVNAVKKPLTQKDRERAKEIARQREQKKILEQARQKEEARIREQAKIEKNAFKRKNPSQKSAEGRAIRNGILGAVAVTAALFVLVFVVHHLYDYIAEKPNFSFVTTGAVEHTIGARALIVRDEDTINCVNAGELVTQITEGSRVAKDQELAIVVPEEMKSVVTDLRNVQSQISDVQQEIILAGGVSEADIIYRNYNKNLSSILDLVRYDAMGGNLSNMSSYVSSVNVILDEREDEMSKIDFDDARISVLRNDEAIYEAQVEKYASVVKAHRPGIVSFRLDGKEEALDYSTFLTLPISEVKGMINNSTGAISSDLSVEADTPVVRIAQNESQ